MIAANRSYFGELDPFGDLICFLERRSTPEDRRCADPLPERAYGTTNISAWSHGWLLLRMVLLAMLKMKFV